MRTAARPAFRRIIEIEQAIRDGSYPNSESLGTEMEVDARTIQRDIAFMRDQLRAPLEFCRKHNGYFYTDRTWSLPAFQLTEGELVSVFLAERLLRQYRGTPFETDSSRAFERIVRMLPNDVTVNLAAMPDTLSVTARVMTTQDVDTVQPLTTASHQPHTNPPLDHVLGLRLRSERAAGASRNCSFRMCSTYNWTNL